MDKKQDNYIKGDHNVICDVCGFKVKSSKTRKRWDGMIVCLNDYETRHPNDFPPPSFPNEGRPVKNARPDRTTDTFVTIGTLLVSGSNWNDINANWEDIINSWDNA